VLLGIEIEEFGRWENELDSPAGAPLFMLTSASCHSGMAGWLENAGIVVEDIVDEAEERFRRSALNDFSSC